MKLVPEGTARCRPALVAGQGRLSRAEPTWPSLCRLRLRLKSFLRANFSCSFGSFVFRAESAKVFFARLVSRRDHLCRFAHRPPSSSATVVAAVLAAVVVAVAAVDSSSSNSCPVSEVAVWEGNAVFGQWRESTTFVTEKIFLSSR